MQKISETENRWRKLVSTYEKLAEFGFIKGTTNIEDKRLKYIRFASMFFVVDVAHDLLLNETTVVWLKKRTMQATPPPLIGICYFIDDIENLIRRYESNPMNLDSNEITLQIYRENSWAMLSDSWTNDLGFKAALSITNEWVWSNLRQLAPWEFERFLHKQRLALQQLN